MSRFPSQPYRVGRALPVLLAYDGNSRTASVRFRGEIRKLRANTKTGAPSNVHVYGLAAVFHGGGKIWPASVTFVESQPGTFRYDDLTVHGFVPGGNGNPPQVTGFIADSRENERGLPQGSHDWLRVMWPTEPEHKRQSF